MGAPPSQRIIDRMDWLDDIADKVQPVVKKALGEAEDKAGVWVRNLLDGTYLGAPLHPMLTDVPIGSWTAALVFDGLDVLAGGSRTMRKAADATLAVGVVGGYAAAVVGYSDWRYLSGGSRRMGMAHAMLNGGGLVLNTASLLLRAAGKRNAGRLAFLTGFSLNAVGAHLGGELSYYYGLRVNREVFEWAGPDEFTAVLRENELSDGEMRQVDLGEGTRVLLARSQKDGEVCAISDVCSHFAGPLADGQREGDTVICPWHYSRFDLCTGEVIDGPAVFPQSTYEVRVREGNIEIKGSEENAQKKVR